MKTRRALAASFVVTVAAIPTTQVGCKKTSDGEDPTGGGTDTARVYRESYTGTCRYSVPEHCPKNATCNPPPPREIDCPSDMRDAGDPPAVARRPPGKEDWVRVRPFIYPNEPTCSVGTESFCAPPGKPISCTTAPPSPKVACKKIAQPDGGAPDAQVHDRYEVASFIWQDGVGACHKTPVTECTAQKRCDLPEGEIVPCP